MNYEIYYTYNVGSVLDGKTNKCLLLSLATSICYRSNNKHISIEDIKKEARRLYGLKYGSADMLQWANSMKFLNENLSILGHVRVWGPGEVANQCIYDQGKSEIPIDIYCNTFHYQPLFPERVNIVINGTSVPGTEMILDMNPVRNPQIREFTKKVPDISAIPDKYPIELETNTVLSAMTSLKNLYDITRLDEYKRCSDMLNKYIDAAKLSMLRPITPQTPATPKPAPQTPAKQRSISTSKPAPLSKSTMGTSSQNTYQTSTGRLLKFDFTRW